jgi:HlyD family secretion protein
VAVERKVVPGPGQSPVPAIRQDTPPRPAGAHHRRRRWIWATLAGVAVAAVVGGEAWRSAHAVTAVRYVTATVSRGSVTRAVTASGSVNPVITIQVGSYISGVVQELYCDYNTVVRKGQLCAKIDPRPYQVVVDQDRATLSTAKAQLTKDETSLALAKLTYERTADLQTRGIVSQDTLDSAKSSLDQATAQVDLDNSTIKLHQATLNAAEINLAYTNILSPVDGTVVSRSITMGQTVAASFQTPTLFLIATDLTKMQVDANVNESDIGNIVVGNRATFTVETFPSRRFEGQVTQVRQAPQTVQNVVTYDVVVSVDNPELLLKPGMTATVRIITDHRDNVLRVPDHALRYTPGGIGGHSRESGVPDDSHRVWVLRDGHPTEVPVAIGLDDDTFAEVAKGTLAAGDEVITSEEVNRATTSGRLPFFRF